MRKDLLEGLGFSDNEASVYLAILRLKAGTGIQIADESGVAKSTTYDTLRTLSRKGLVNIYKKQGRKYFSANDPATLKEIQTQQRSSLDRVFPELVALYDRGAAGTNVRLYKGKEGIELVSDEILAEAKELIGIGSPEELFKKLPDLFPRLTRLRKEKGVRFRAIFRDSPMARERQQQDREDLRESKLVKPSIPFSPLMWVWGSKIAMITFTEEIAVVVIENAELAQMIRAIFELLWEETE